MRPLWQLCLPELLRNGIIHCIMPVTKSSELFMFHSIEIMISWIIRLGLYTSLFSVVCRREMLDTPVNMYNVYSVTPAVTHLCYSRREMVSIRNAMSPMLCLHCYTINCDITVLRDHHGGVEAATGVESDVSKWSRAIALVADCR